MSFFAKMKTWKPTHTPGRRKPENLDTQSAGINRHEVENERVLQERSSEPS
jgi:hypothetical protein